MDGTDMTLILVLLGAVLIFIAAYRVVIDIFGSS
jgi:hypothetical protein